MNQPWQQPTEVEPGRSLYAHDLERRLLDGIAVGPGDTVLELAAGFGALCLRLAGRVRPGGRTICSDIRPERVAAMEDLIRRDGAEDIEVRTLDMLRLDLANSSVDGILCRWGLMFALPPERAVSEAIRVLRPRRRLAVAVWAEPALNPWITLVDAAIQDAGLQVPDDRRGPGRMFSLGAPGKLASLLRAAGFEDVTVDGVDLTWEYRSFEAYWEEEVLIPGPFEAFFDSLQQVQLGAVRDRLRSLLGPYALETGGYRVPGVTLVASGRRPTAGAPGRARGEMATLPRALSD
jgi:SAM-dependent methyltransferase